MLRRIRGAQFARSDLRASVVDAFCHGSMMGLGETYIPAFALALGMGEVISGLVTTLPMLAGGLLQLLSPWGAYLLRSRRRWVVTTAAIQAAAFVPLVYGALAGSLSTFALFAAASLYWWGGLATGPSWYAWMETLVPARVRGRYFARRTRMAQAALMGGIIGGGVALSRCSGSDGVLLAFALVFAGAGLSRSISALALATQREPVLPPADARPKPLLSAFQTTLTSKASVLLTFLLLMQGSVQISAPFFSAFMLVRLGMSYEEYLILLATAYLSKIVALSFLDGVARRIGLWRLFVLGSIGLIPLPALCLVSPSFTYLCSVQVVSGFAWAAFELGMYLLLFQEVPSKQKTEILTVFNFGNMTATAVGSLIGVLLLSVPSDAMLGYAVVFFGSSVGRLLALGAIVGWQPSSVRRVEVFRPFETAPAPVVADGAADASFLPFPEQAGLIVPDRPPVLAGEGQEALAG